MAVPGQQRRAGEGKFPGSLRVAERGTLVAVGVPWGNLALPRVSREGKGSAALPPAALRRPASSLLSSLPAPMLAGPRRLPLAARSPSCSRRLGLPPPSLPRRRRLAPARKGLRPPAANRRGVARCQPVPIGFPGWPSEARGPGFAAFIRGRGRRAKGAPSGQGEAAAVAALEAAGRAAGRSVARSGRGARAPSARRRRRRGSCAGQVQVSAGLGAGGAPGAPRGGGGERPAGRPAGCLRGPSPKPPRVRPRAGRRWGGSRGGGGALLGSSVGDVTALAGAVFQRWLATDLLPACLARSLARLAASSRWPCLLARRPGKAQRRRTFAIRRARERWDASLASSLFRVGKGLRCSALELALAERCWPRSASGRGRGAGSERLPSSQRGLPTEGVGPGSGAAEVRGFRGLLCVSVCMARRWRTSIGCRHAGALGFESCGASCPMP